MAASVPDRSQREIEAVATNLFLEAGATEVAQAFRQAGRRSVLFKGVVTGRWLYAGDPRIYGDVDLMVAPSDFDECERVLILLGFERSPIERALPSESPQHATTWARGSLVVDLHRTLAGLSVSPEKAWLELSTATEIWAIGGVDVEVLGLAARCLTIALHMAQHGPSFAGTFEDLARAISQTPESTWVEAANLARRLQAEAAMARGLMALDEGVALCETVGLDDAGVVTIEGSPTFHAVQGLLWLTQMTGIRAKIGYAMTKFFPPRTVMYSRVAWSRKGSASLCIAYFFRIGRFALVAPRTALTFARLKRSSNRSSR